MKKIKITDLSQLKKGVIVTIRTVTMRNGPHGTYLDPAFFIVKSCIKIGKSELQKEYSGSEHASMFKQHSYDYHRVELIQFKVSMPKTISMVARTQAFNGDDFTDIVKQGADSFEICQSSLEELKLHLAKEESEDVKKLFTETNVEFLKIQEGYAGLIGKVMTWTIEK